MFTRISTKYKFASILLCGMLSTHALAKTSFELSNVTIEPGKMNSYFAKRGAVELPVTVIQGQHSGPVLLLTAGIHGDEFPAMFALQRLKNDIDTSELKGTVIIVHLANLAGFHGRRIALSPKDEKNLNREFPGKLDGTHTQQVAAFLTDEFISRADFLIDMHSGRTSGTLLPHVYSPFVGDEKLDKLTFEFAKATGMKHIVMYGERPRDPNNSISYPNTAMTRGKPGLTTEIGHLGQRKEEDILADLDVVFNAMKFLKMLPGSAKENPAPEIYNSLTAIASPADGFFTASAKVGDKVEKGETVARITDYFGEPIATLKAPVSGIVLMINQSPPIKKGESPVTIAVK